MLVHCWAGVSRSMAAAYILLCDRLGPGTEARDRAGHRARRAPHAYPNPLMVAPGRPRAGPRRPHGARPWRPWAAAGIVGEGDAVELPLSLGGL